MFMISCFSPPLVPFLLALLGACILALFIYFRLLIKSNDIIPNMYFKESSLMVHIMKKCRLLHRPFKPPVFMSNSHIQTILSRICHKPDVHYEREYLLMKDRGVVSLDWVVFPESKFQDGSPVLILIPEVTRNATSVSGLAYIASESGYRAVVFNRRGHGESLLTVAKLQGFGDPNDLRQVVKYLRGRHFNVNILAVAMGTGSGLLLSYLGEYGSSAHVAAAVCVSGCYEAQEILGKCLRNIYDFAYLFGLKKILCAHSKAFSKLFDVKAALNCWSFKDYDETVYCKIYGHKSADEYWERNNPMRDADDIAVPLLCINSLDDPFCTKEGIPYELFRCYPNFLLVVTEKGGHCGFLENLSGISWAEHLSLGYLKAVLDLLLKEQK